MKNTLLFICLLCFLAACGGKATNNTAASPPTASAPAAQPAESPMPADGIPKDGTYTGLGKITKINAANGSVEIDHEKIPAMMPAMKMEFNVKDKALLNGLKVGDDVKFAIEYKHPTETITAIKKRPQ